jgi:hypothetical protein
VSRVFVRRASHVRVSCDRRLQVTVRRSGPLVRNGYDWTVTFVSDPGA